MRNHNRVVEQLYLIEVQGSDECEMTERDRCEMTERDRCAVISEVI